MKDERNHIDHLFRAALDNHTEAPPPDVWAALEQRLPAEKRRRSWGWLWGTLILLALLGGTAAVYSVLKKNDLKAGTGRVLADGNPTTDNKAGQTPATEEPTATDHPSTTPTTSPAATTGNPTNNSTATAGQRVASNTPRSNRGSGTPQRGSRRASQAANNPQPTDPNADPIARNAQPGRSPNATSNRGGDNPNSIADNTPANRTPRNNSPRPSRRKPGTANTRANNPSVGAPVSAADQSRVASNDAPERRSRNNNNGGRNRRTGNAGNSNNSRTASANGAEPGTTASTTTAKPARNRTGSAGGDAPRNGGNRRGAGNPGSNNRRGSNTQDDPADGIVLGSGESRNPARKPKTTDATIAGKPRKPARTTGTNNTRKPDDGIDVPPTTARRGADNNPGQPNRTTPTALRDDLSTNPAPNPAQPTATNQPPANPAPQAGTKPTGRFSDDDPRGSKGLLVSDYIAKSSSAGATGGKDADGNQDSDDSKTATAGGGGGGGGAAPDKPRARPAPRGRWEGGMKLGYEIGAGGSDKINKAVIGPYVQYNISDRAAVVFQPAYKSGQFGGGSKSESETYFRVLAPPNVNTSSTLVVLDSNVILDTLYTQTVSQSYDSIIVSRKIDGESFWEIDLPLLFSYQLSKMFSFFAGPVFSFNRQFTQSGTQQSFTINRSQTFDSLQTPEPASTYTNLFNTGQPAIATAPAAGTTDIKTGMGVGYMAGVQARFGMISADLTAQQRLTGLPEQAKAPQVRSALSMPYIRLTLGVRLFGNGKKKPTDRDMLNEQPYQRSEE